MSRIKNLEDLTHLIKRSETIDRPTLNFFNVLIQRRTVEPTILEKLIIIELRNALEEKEAQTQRKISKLKTLYFSPEQFRSFRDALPSYGKELQNPLDRAKLIIKILFKEPFKDRIALSAIKKESKLVKDMILRINAMHPSIRESTEKL
jgi:hypothetical protein